MKRVALLVVLALAGAGAASTASNRVSASTLGYQSVRVSGATMTDISYTISGTSITGFAVKLRGSQLLKLVSASFNGGLPGVCVVGLYDATSNKTSVTCTGFAQPANRSWSLQITVS